MPERFCMVNNVVKSEIEVNEMKIGVMRVEGMEYISLTDLARWANAEDPRIPIYA